MTDTPQTTPPHIAALIVAAGRGRRAGGGLPKQYRRLGGGAVLGHAARLFSARADVASLVVVIHPDDAALAKEALPAGTRLAMGGESRAASVAAGLAALPDAATHVLIHDAARPLTPAAVIGGVIEALHSGAEGAAPALPVSDALWRGAGGSVTAAVPRGGLSRAQTPQGFALPAIRAAHAKAPAEAADDVEVALAAGIKVVITEGHENNFKLTYPADFARAEGMLTPKEERPMDIRTGNGFDVHRFGPGDHVTLCGVQIPLGRGLQGHSDADVAMHTVTDAIYGALAMGDIGQHFPPSDPQWRGAASEIFLRHAVDLARSEGFTITHMDCTVICEFPKVGPHAGPMRAEMARIMGLDVSRVSVKATTSERLGFTGRGEGIAAMATVTLVAS
ncbi:bifunctional 2-C-methyl-D-erythritol 4-phosphate cytidylyltransferase/2-C-methyl-D-erythritol 2,4-cyclodiphosphate synthase [Alphaproteobacteria bacterium KMM 3653]|uniref:Bifunctional enzyme IspD/IspF n=1 Tax=Harenicola maris TaxID=2841044 RepID=A0AAP2CQY2_9RHOB|nr:bifunctional 2-C-methyl-D-erythritol 4-phosphate cytidylyltransferase/2-C-methyl-D-erythritol 2,4-cyclodiphosphate synthase [Harenicola maris]